MPDDHPRVSPYLIVSDCAETTKFLENVFNAEEREKFLLPDGTINHAEVSIGDSVIMMGKASDKNSQYPAMIYIYVKDVNSVYKRSLENGTTTVMEPANQIYGDRVAAVKDRDGINWWMSTRIENLTHEEISGKTNKVPRYFFKDYILPTAYNPV
jgi:PhnB protein